MKKRLVLIVTAFCISFVLMVALSLFSMQRFNTYAQYSDMVDVTNRVITRVYDAEKAIRDIDRTERGYMLTKDTMYLRLMNNAIDTIYSATASIENMTRDNPMQCRNMALFKANVAIRLNALRSNINYVDTCKHSTLSKYYYESRQDMTNCSKKLKEIHTEENRRLEEHFKGEQVYLQLATNTLYTLLGIFCAITLLLFAIMIKELRSRMRYQEELQAKVIDLKRSHDELQEIAYAASHDLQEPLRKIQVFSNMLMYQKSAAFSDGDKDTLKRINGAANRMQMLITDLMSLTTLTKTEEAKIAVDTGRILKYILIDNEERINEKGAAISINNLPVITGYENQLKILFRALIDNSLKFVREGVKPVITVSCEITDGKELLAVNANLRDKKFHCISFRDNGIGFDNKFMDRIFRIFQRLHNQESAYSGKGIGLAICQRIMANHEGYVTAHGEPGAGAVFTLFFPVSS